MQKIIENEQLIVLLEYYIKNSDIKSNVKISNNPAKPKKKYGYKKSVLEAKNQTDFDDWFKYSRALNSHELVIYRKYRAINRAFFKMWELLETFPLVPIKCSKTYSIPLYNTTFSNILSQPDRKIVVVNLADAPGGFVEAIHKYRKMFSNYFKKDYFLGMSLKCDKITWNKKLRYIKQFEYIWGNPSSKTPGDINILENILFLKTYLGLNKADLVTADGGMNVTGRDNIQEQIHLQLFFNEILAAFYILKKGGNFICKFYEMVTLPTMQLIQLLIIFYENVYITKPVTSRLTNSEKYIVCLKFRGIKDDTIEQLSSISKQWNKIDNSGGCELFPTESFAKEYFINRYVLDTTECKCKFVQKLFMNILDKRTVKNIKIYNRWYGKRQRNKINEILTIARNGGKYIINEDTDENTDKNTENTGEIDVCKEYKKRQIIISKKWQKLNKIPNY